MTTGWPFLVARGRTRDYRTVLVPDFLAERGLSSLLADSLHEPGAGSTCTVVVGNGDTGPLSVSYRAAVLRASDLADTAQDDHEPGAAAHLLDEHGRPLEYLYGIVSRGDGVGPVADADVSRARDAALHSYRRFLDDEDGFTFDRSPSTPVSTSGHVPLPTTASPLPPSPALLHEPIGESTVGLLSRPALSRSMSASTGEPRPTMPRRALLLAGSAGILLAGLITSLVATQSGADPVTAARIVQVVQPEGAPSCTVEATAQITVVEAPVDVVLHWQLDGREVHAQEATLREAGVTDLTRVLEVRGTSGEVSVVVEEPNPVSARPVAFTVDCPPAEAPAAEDSERVVTPVEGTVIGSRRDRTPSTGSTDPSGQHR
jgi:hypothetical protein